METSYNSIVWTLDPVKKTPLVCVAGSIPKQIQIFDVDKSEHARSLVGHGKGINDLAISPLSTSILASAAEDYMIRLWNLEPKYEEQPCVAIFAGEGHKQPILAAQFHHNGRWMLSGGLDTAVCLWAVPSLEELERDDTLDGYPDPKTVYYPHFHSTEVHANYIDTLVFYDDLIISRSAKDQNTGNKNNEILLWKIDGFDPSAPASAEPPIPKPGVYTRRIQTASTAASVCCTRRACGLSLPWATRFPSISSGTCRSWKKGTILRKVQNRRRAGESQKERA